MARSIRGPGGGAPDARRDDKIARESWVVQIIGHPPEPPRGWRRVLKRSTTKKRRQRDKDVVRKARERPESPPS